MAANLQQLAQDNDFLSASPDDQIKYLSSFDSDFAKASREDQLGYIGHVQGTSAVPAPIRQAVSDQLKTTVPRPTVQPEPQSLLGTLADIAKPYAQPVGDVLAGAGSGALLPRIAAERQRAGF